MDGDTGGRRGRRSIGLQLLYDLANGTAGCRQARRYYEVAADIASRHPELGEQVEAAADKLAREAADGDR